MKRVIMFQTADGVIHQDRGKANHHVDATYGNAISSLAHKLVRLNKYTEIVTFIDENIDQFVKLAAIKKDMILDDDDIDKEED